MSGNCSPSSVSVTSWPIHSRAGDTAASEGRPAAPTAPATWWWGGDSKPEGATKRQCRVRSVKTPERGGKEEGRATHRHKSAGNVDHALAADAIRGPTGYQGAECG